MQDYIKLEQTLHQVCQILAKLNRSLLEERDDDSHTNLRLDLLHKRILGQPFVALGRVLYFGLDLDNLEIGLYSGLRNSLFTLSLEGKNLSELENQLAHRLSEYPIALSDWQVPMHYKIPEYSNKKEAPKINPYLINKWFQARRLADEAGHYLNSTFNTDSPMRIWPHHFDSGLYLELPNNRGLGFGLAMADQLIPLPYFYATYSSFEGNKAFTLSPTAPWHFHQSNTWEGMVYPIDDQFLDSLTSQKHNLSNFLKESIAWYGL